MSELDHEWNCIDAETRAAVQKVIDECRRTGRMARAGHGEDGSVFAYPHASGGIAWGFDGGPFGFNAARGVKP
jgi:hypothetical protein